MHIYATKRFIIPAILGSIVGIIFGYFAFTKDKPLAAIAIAASCIFAIAVVTSIMELMFGNYNE